MCPRLLPRSVPADIRTRDFLCRERTLYHYATQATYNIVSSSLHKLNQTSGVGRKRSAVVFAERTHSVEQLYLDVEVLMCSPDCYVREILYCVCERDAERSVLSTINAARDCSVHNQQTQNTPLCATNTAVNRRVTAR